MAWVRLDDHFDEHPKMAQVGPLGIALWAAGLAYCNRNLTDGFIPWAVAEKLLSWEFAGERDNKGRRKRFTIAVTSGMHGEDVTPDLVISLLLEAGLWDEVDGGYCVHDYGDYQPSKADVLADKEAKQRAGRAGGKARAEAAAQARAQAESKHVLKQNPSRAQAESKQNASKTPSKTQAKSKPDPDPDPDPKDSNANALSSSPPPDSEDIGFRERYGELVTAYGGHIDSRLAREYQQIAEDWTDADVIREAIRACMRANDRPYPSKVREHLPPLQPVTKANLPPGAVILDEQEPFVTPTPWGKSG